MQVEKFKNDYMKGRELYASDTLYTKSALLTRERLSALRLISTFPNDQKVQHDEYYYNDTSTRFGTPLRKASIALKSSRQGDKDTTTD